jgi:phosphohistidine swiveling domain-containing protein
LNAQITERTGILTQGGTYDILSPRYDEAPDLYFDWTQKTIELESIKPFSFTLPQMRKLTSLLKLHGLHSDPVGLFDFLQAGIELREKAKFYFTKNLSDALSLIGKYGEKYGFSKEELSYCDLSVFQELHIAALDPVEMIGNNIKQGKARYKETLSLSLPPLITNSQDVWGFEYPESEPNFITQKQVRGPVISNIEKSKLSGAIVCITNADPGYDWLFSYQIAGLITTWGGANSHMAIRAGELGLPAVIGAGELLYEKWSEAKLLHLDCSGRRVEVLA